MTTTIKTRADGRKYKVVDQRTILNHKFDVVEMIKETTEEINNRVCRIGKVFNVEEGIGISASHWMLYPNGTIHNGTDGKDNWKFDSIEQAELFLAKFKVNNK